MTHFDVKKIRSEFPLISHDAYKYAYLDNGATSQKPQVVLDRMDKYYCEQNANIHRGVYHLSEVASKAYEDARARVGKFINSPATNEIIYTRGTTESINLIASSWGRTHIKAGDEIILTVAEHHSNIVPWQILAETVGATIKYIPVSEDFRLDMDEARKLFSEKTKLLSLAHVSNVLGVIHPVKELIALAQARGAITVLDGAQAVPHLKVDVQDLGCDFYAFSGHKMLAPTGIGILWGKAELLNEMPPYQGGGDMISSVTLEKSTWNEIPFKFEAGTPNICGAIGLATAIEYLEGLDRDEALKHDIALAQKAARGLKEIDGIKILSPYEGNDLVGICTFVSDYVHPHDMAAICDTEGVCVRAGHHCAQPLMQHFKVPATTRVSPYLYNTEEEIDRLIAAVAKATNLLK